MVFTITSTSYLILIVITLLLTNSKFITSSASDEHAPYVVLNEECYELDLNERERGGNTSMTNTQVQYANYQESKRANRARETETHRANVASEQQAVRTLAETTRHNKAEEAVDMLRNMITREGNVLNAETSRYNTELKAATDKEIAAANRINQYNIAKEDRAVRSYQAQIDARDKANQEYDRAFRRQFLDEDYASVFNLRDAQAENQRSDAEFTSGPKTDKTEAETAKTNVDVWRDILQLPLATVGAYTVGKQAFKTAAKVNANATAKAFTGTSNLGAGLVFLPDFVLQYVNPGRPMPTHHN